MPRAPEPGDSGFSESGWMGHLINVGLRIARGVGTGLKLFNAMREEVPAAEPEQLGEASSIVGRGIRSAMEAMNGPRDAPLPLESMPGVPPDYFSGEESERIVAMADVGFTDDRTNEESEWNTVVQCSEGCSFDELEEKIREKFGDCAAWTDPELCDHLVNVYVNLFFLGRRF